MIERTKKRKGNKCFNRERKKEKPDIKRSEEESRGISS